MRLLHAGLHPDDAAAAGRRISDPDEAEIRHYLSGNLCRCAAYPEIIKAVKSAARKMQARRNCLITKKVLHDHRNCRRSCCRSGPWYRSLTRQQWNVLVATNLGWLFDGFENYALILTAGPALRQLLDPSLYGGSPPISAPLSALISWAGASAACSAASLADYFGRKRVMIFSILAYSVLTGSSCLLFQLDLVCGVRFLVGVAVGSEWATGSSMIAELGPTMRAARAPA